MNKYNDFTKYCTIERWSGYWHQLNETFKLNPASVLEIGVGDGTYGAYIKRNTNIRYRSLDIDPEACPDIVSSADSIPLESSSVDTVCAFEVLEHLPFEKFPVCLAEMKRVARQNVLISLPHWGRHFSFLLRIPFFHKLMLSKKFNFMNPSHKYDGRHYWEIGKKGYGVKKIKEAINKTGLTIEDDYVCFDSPYHHFFILKK